MRFASLGRVTAAVALVAAAALPAAAQQDIRYATLGTFTGTNCIGFGCGSLGLFSGLYVGFDEQAPVTAGTPSTVSLGFFDADGFRLLGGSPSLTTTGDFFLTVFQTQPTLGVGTFAGNFGGRMTLTSSNLIWTPDQTVLQIGKVRYELTESSYLLNVPSNFEGKVEVLANASIVTPEPATVLLMGSGLLGLLAVGARRKRVTA